MKCVIFVGGKLKQFEKYLILDSTLFEKESLEN